MRPGYMAIIGSREALQRLKQAKPDEVYRMLHVTTHRQLKTPSITELYFSEDAQDVLGKIALDLIRKYIHNDTRLSKLKQKTFN